MLRSLLTDRYGKDFMTLASENKLADVKVPERLLKGLSVRPPSKELVESYLKEIARAYKVPWGGLDDGDEEDGDGDLGEFQSEVDFIVEDAIRNAGVDGDGDENGKGDGGDGDERASKLIRRASETAELTRATPPRGFNAQAAGKSPVSVAPPGPRSDNPNPRVKVPGPSDSGKEVGSPSPANRSRDKSGIPEVDELSRRFAALKR
ncbi:hypothetical protein BJY04DRAFT_200179 [Aspergillus karnatakaensis]|uniref:uncharacterized protein n=1 Tax=Aspergillus karnatakaensis TaxID=1810916 RepID=UPI003CCD1199